MLIIYLAVTLIFIIIFLFSSKSLSPIPYFPTQKIDLPLIINALNLHNNQIIFDLGAGDGIVIFEAAKKAFQKGLNTKFIAVEINPVLIFILHLRRLFHPNRKNIKIILDDIFKMDYKRFSRDATRYTFYLYISPWFIEKTLRNIQKQVSKYSVVSYMYSVKSLKKKKKKKIVKGKNHIFTYY